MQCAFNDYRTKHRKGSVKDLFHIYFGMISKPLPANILCCRIASQAFAGHHKTLDSGKTMPGTSVSGRDSSANTPARRGSSRGIRGKSGRHCLSHSKFIRLQRTVSTLLINRPGHAPRVFCPKVLDLIFLAVSYSEFCRTVPVTALQLNTLYITDSYRIADKGLTDRQYRKVAELHGQFLESL
jgi:hypothetical protein